MVFSPSSKSLSQTEIDYTLQGCEVGIRVDGRSLKDVRPYQVSIGTLSLSNGSARVFLPGGETDIICSVKAEVCPSRSQSDNGDIQISVEFLGDAGVSTNFGMRNKTMKREAELSKILQKLLANAIDLRGLCIVPGKWVWGLYVDILVLASEGNLLDCCSFAAFSALNATLLPHITCIKQTDDRKKPSKASDDFLVDADISKATLPPGIDLCPVVVTVSKVSNGNHMIVDALPEEEMCASALVSVSVDQKGSICGIQKCGSGSLPISQLNHITEVATNVSSVLFRNIQASIKKQSNCGETSKACSDLLQNYFEII